MSGYAFYSEKRTEAIVLEKTVFALGKKLDQFFGICVLCKLQSRIMHLKKMYLRSGPVSTSDILC